MQLQQALARARDAVTRNRALLAQAAQNENQLQIQLASRRSHVSALNQGAHDQDAAREQMARDRAARAETTAELEAPLAERQELAEQARATVALVQHQLDEVRQGVQQAEQALQEFENEGAAKSLAVKTRQDWAQGQRAQSERASPAPQEPAAGHAPAAQRGIVELVPVYERH